MPLAETVREIYKSVVNELSVYQKVNYVDIKL